MKKTNKLAFTLIELLVVITIIGILATVGVNQFGKSLQKARDSKRISDLGTIKTAITQAFTDEQEYPSTKATEFSGSLSSYIDRLPKDGKHLQPGNKKGDLGNQPALGYVYMSGEDKAGIQLATYEISTAFEADGNIKNMADNAKDNGNDMNRYEMGNVSMAWNTSLKKGATCTSNNSDLSKAIIIGDDDYLCAATPY